MQCILIIGLLPFGSTKNTTKLLKKIHKALHSGSMAQSMHTEGGTSTDKIISYHL